MAYNRYENAHQKLQRVHQNIRCFSDNDNDRSKMDTLPSIGELAEPSITSYLAYLVKKGKVEQICFLLTQHITESCPTPKNLKDITRLLTNIQKK